MKLGADGGGKMLWILIKKNKEKERSHYIKAEAPCTKAELQLSFYFFIVVLLWWDEAQGQKIGGGLL